MELTKVQIFNYETAEEFLSAAYRNKKRRNSTFSMRAWARKLGLASNATLSLMLAGKRPIPRKYIHVFASELGMTSKESLYFESLVEMAKAKNAKARVYYQERAHSFRPNSGISFIEIESFQTLSHPLHMGLLEMIDLKECTSNIKSIRESLRVPTSLNEIEEALARLLLLGLVEKSPTGLFSKTHSSISTRPDIADEGSQEYHRRISIQASEAVSQQDICEREFNGYAINIKKESIPRAKELIRQFIADFAKEVEAVPKTGEETYQLNVQFFALTKNFLKLRSI